MVAGDTTRDMDLGRFIRMDVDHRGGGGKCLVRNRGEVESDGWLDP